MLDRLTKLREERANNDKGFTLIELLVVVVIIGILIAIAIPLYLNYTKGANDKSAESDLRGAISAFEQCNSDNSTYPSAVSGSGAISGCTGDTQLPIGAKTTLSYTYVTATSSYVVESQSSTGTKTIFCYDSSKGGSIAKVTSTQTLAPAGALTGGCPA